MFATVTDQSIQSLLMLPRAERESTHGMERIDVVAPASHYERRAGHLYGLEHVRYMQQLQLERSVLRQSFNPVYRLVLRDAVVLGQGSVLLRSGVLIHDSAAEFLNHKEVPTGLLPADERRYTLAAGQVHRAIDAPCLLVKRPWWRNYGHWLVDGAALVANLGTIRLPSNLHIIIGAFESEPMRQVVHETLVRLAPHIPLLEHPDNEIWSIPELHYVTPVHVPPLFKLPSGLKILRAMFANNVSRVPQPRRLFVARSSKRSRNLLNEQEVLEIALKQGCEVIYPETLTLREQAAAFRDASIVIGVKGAALANIVFAPNSLGIIVLSPGTFIDAFFWDLAAQFHMDYTEIFGRPRDPLRSESETDFTIEPDVFSGALSSLMRRLEA